MPESLLSLLVEGQILTAAQAGAINREALANQTTGYQQLLAGGLFTEEALLKIFSEKLGVPEIKLTSLNLSVVKLVPLDQIQALGCLPVQLGPDNQTVWLVTADPTYLVNIEKIRAIMGRPVKAHLTTRAMLKTAMKAITDAAAGMSRSTATAAPAKNGPAPVPAYAPASAATSTPRGASANNHQIAVRKFRPQDQVTQILNQILTEAVNKGASDVHLDCEPTHIRVRYRLEGALFDVFHVPIEQKEQLISRTKVIAGLDISEHRVPQDGRAKLKIGNDEVGFRINIMPAMYGENIVFRVLRQSNLHLDLAKIGFSAQQLDIFRRGIQSPNGMLLVTGPTGSGKTTTLYSALLELNLTTAKIVTVEDPVEYTLPGVTQVQINKDTGLDFAEVLRSLLRQDPDIILVGEIRDLETAKVAIQASLTGHLVFSSLHTNDAPSAIVRLLNMGIEPFAVLGAVNTVVAQRMLRRICPSCAQPDTPAEAVLAGLGPDRAIVAQTRFMRGAGCDHCLGGGYYGRCAIYEVLELGDALKESILKGENLISIRRRAIESGMMTLRQSALFLVATGVTTLEEAIGSTIEK